jgi:hypothetical protein
MICRLLPCDFWNADTRRVITFKLNLVCLSSTDRHAWFDDSLSALVHLRWLNLAFRRCELWIQILSYLINIKAACLWFSHKSYITSTLKFWNCRNNSMNVKDCSVIPNIVCHISVIHIYRDHTERASRLNHSRELSNEDFSTVFKNVAQTISVIKRFAVAKLNWGHIP